MLPTYLAGLEWLLTDGAARLPAPFRRRQVDFVRGAQCADGGFAGRLGCGDPYYTDFAQRLLVICGVDDPPLTRRIAGYWQTAAPPPVDILEAFLWLNAGRMCRNAGVPWAASFPIRDLLDAQCAGVARLGAYQAFLAGMSYQILDQPIPDAAAWAAAILALQREDGGFAEDRSAGVSQTNATAAAVATLLMTQALRPAIAARGLAFLRAMQQADGGFLAHAAAPESDLLSTFTACMTLLTVEGGQQGLHIAGVARYTRGLALPGGGFRASASDDAADVEYTYYGVGTLALLATLLG